MARKSIKTAKLKADDRVKLIDRPDMLVVIPKTHAASVRYGSGSSWCTAIPSDNEHFNSYTGRGFLVYIIYYNLTEEGKRGAEKYKIAFHVRTNPNKPTVFSFDGYDKDDCYISDDLLKNIILTEEVKTLVDEYVMTDLEERYGVVIGTKVQGKNLSSDKFKKMKVELKSDEFELSFYLNPKELVEGIVTKVNGKSVRVDVNKIDIKSVEGTAKTLIEEMVRDNKLNLLLKNEFVEKIPKG